MSMSAFYKHYYHSLSERKLVVFNPKSELKVMSKNEVRNASNRLNIDYKEND